MSFSGKTYLRARRNSSFKTDRRALLSRFGYVRPQVKMQQKKIQRILSSSKVQAKLTVGQSDDRYEQEAGRVANRVMDIPDPEPHRKNEEQGKEESIQTKAASDKAPAIAPRLASGINSLKGSGQPLSRSSRRFFEPRFGYDFSKVRVHNNSAASIIAQSINARAFTRGRNIVFNEGQYSPENSSGKRLLAHELTHVVQQRSNENKKGFQDGIRNKISKLEESHTQPVQKFDIKNAKWEDGVKAAEGPYKNTQAKNQAKIYYKELLVRAAKKVTAPSPLLDKKPTVADIRWSWTKSGQWSATMDAKQIDNFPKDFWKWLKFNPNAVQKEEAWTVSAILHELDHAAHAKTLFDAWQKAGKKTGWDSFWLSHFKKWTEPAIAVGRNAGILGTLAGLPPKINPSAIEFRAYTNQFINFFHRFSSSMQGLIAKGVILFYPLAKQKVTANIKDPAMDVAAARTKLLAHFNSPPGKNPAEKRNLKILMTAELKAALLFFRPLKDRAQIEKDFPAVFNFKYTSAERRNARKQYKPQP